MAFAAFEDVYGEDVYNADGGGLIQPTSRTQAVHFITSSTDPQIIQNPEIGPQPSISSTSGGTVRIDGSTGMEKALQTFTLVSVIGYIFFLGAYVDTLVHGVQTGRPDLPEWWTWVDRAFVLGIALELAISLTIRGKAAFRGQHGRWHLFDFCILVFALLDHTLRALSINLSFIMLSRVCRAVRFARVVRSFRDMKDLRLMVAAILSSSASILWALVLLFFVIYLFAVTMLLFLTRSDVRELSMETSQIFEYFGSLTTSMLTLFGAISGGHDWSDVMQPVERVSTRFARFYFVFYVAVTLFGVMNILTAVFVRNTGQIAKFDRELVIMEERQKMAQATTAIKRLMKAADVDGDGIINETELEAQLRKSETLLYLRSLGIDDADVRRLYKLLADGTGEVSVDEFVAGMLRLRGQAKALDTASLMLETKRRGQELRALMTYIEDRFDFLGDQALQPDADSQPSTHKRISEYIQDEKDDECPDGGTAEQRIDRLASIGGHTLLHKSNSAL